MIHVFDFDDTLIWAPEWYDKIELEGRKVISPGNSQALKSAMRVLKGYDLEYTYYPTISGRDVCFRVMKDGEPIDKEELLSKFSKKTLRFASVSLAPPCGSPAVTNDFQFYFNHNNIGTIPNKEVMDIYMECDEPMVLTARINTPEMNDKIEKVLSKYKVPSKIFTRPNGLRSGKFKGQVLSDLAIKDDVTFYDDNDLYIVDAEKVLKENGVLDRVTINKVSTVNKPKGRFSHLR